MRKRSPLLVIDRQSKQLEKEQIYGRLFLETFYGKSLYAKLFHYLILPFISRFALFSYLYGLIQKSALSRYKVKSFIKRFKVDESEFKKLSAEFTSFNDFFIRELKKEARPIDSREGRATLPADGRYLVFPNLFKTKSFFVKGKRFHLEDLLQDEVLAKKYQSGAMVIARLCPTDYHRFHFPIDCIPDKPHSINGALYSVNPIALKKNIEFLTENKRVITALHTQGYGTILYIEVGATCVGTIHQTYRPHQFYKKGEEKGYFSFGGSCLVLLFEENAITFDADLIENSENLIETKALMGMSLGTLQKIAPGK